MPRTTCGCTRVKLVLSGATAGATGARRHVFVPRVHGYCARIAGSGGPQPRTVSTSLQPVRP